MLAMFVLGLGYLVCVLLAGVIEHVWPESRDVWFPEDYL